MQQPKKAYIFRFCSFSYFKGNCILLLSSNCYPWYYVYTFLVKLQRWLQMQEVRCFGDYKRHKRPTRREYARTKKILPTQILIFFILQYIGYHLITQLLLLLLECATLSHSRLGNEYKAQNPYSYCKIKSNKCNN